MVYVIGKEIRHLRIRQLKSTRASDMNGVTVWGIQSSAIVSLADASLAYQYAERTPGLG